MSVWLVLRTSGYPIECAFHCADRDYTDYFRGIVKKGEMSNRVLELTEDIIRLNPAHYSAWWVLDYRKTTESNPRAGSTGTRPSLP